MARPHLLPLIFCVLLAIPASADAFTWSRVWAPETDLSGLGAIGVEPIRVDGARYFDGDYLADDLAAALSAEGFLDARSINDGEKAQGIAVVITGNARVDTDTDYGSTPVQREYWVWRDITENGKTRSVQQREYRTVYVRTETVRVEVQLDLTARHAKTNTLLGTARIERGNSSYWQEDYGWRSSGNADALVENLLPDIIKDAAAKFSPTRVEVKRGFRPERGPDGNTKLGIAAAESGDYERALQLFTAAIAEDPKGAADLYGNLAMVYEAMGRVEEAKAAIETGMSQPHKGGHNLKAHMNDLSKVQGIAPKAYFAIPAIPQSEPEPVMPSREPAESLAYVVRIDGGQIYIDAGLDRGWTAGMTLRVEQRDPIHNLDGELLGTHVATIGSLRISEVYDQYCVAESLTMDENQEQQMRVGMVVLVAEEGQDRDEGQKDA